MDQQTMRVLVVDDEPAHREVMSYLLNGLGCEVVHSANGLQSLQQILNNHFDFVVMDWRMPEWSGGQTLERCDLMLERVQPGAPVTPVLIYSGQAMNLMQLPMCKHFQIRCYLSKKATPSQQQRLLHRFIGELRRGFM